MQTLQWVTQPSVRRCFQAADLQAYDWFWNPALCRSLQRNAIQTQSDNMLQTLTSATRRQSFWLAMLGRRYTFTAREMGDRLLLWGDIFVTPTYCKKRIFREHQIFAIFVMTRIEKLNTRNFLELPITISLSAWNINT